MQTSLTCDLPSTSCFSSAICSAPSVMKKASIFRNLGELMCVECPCIHLFDLGRYILIVLIFTSSFVFSSSKIKCFKNCNTTWKYPQENELTYNVPFFSFFLHIDSIHRLLLFWLLCLFPISSVLSPQVISIHLLFW